MSGFEILNERLDDLTLDMKALKLEVFTANTKRKELEKRLEQFTTRLQTTFERHLEELFKLDLSSTLEVMQKDLNSETIKQTLSELDNDLGKMTTLLSDLPKRRTVISKQLDVICAEIDHWRKTERKRKFRRDKGKGKSARDNSKVVWLDQNLMSIQEDLGFLKHEVQRIQKGYRTLTHAHPEILSGVIDNMRLILNETKRSVETITASRRMLEETASKLPADLNEWDTLFLNRLREREYHLAPNMKLNALDIQTYTTRFFDDEWDRQQLAYVALKKEHEGITGFRNKHIELLELHRFDVYKGAVNGKKKTMDKPSNQMAEALNKALDELHSPTEILLTLKKHENHLNTVKKHLKTLVSEAPTVVKRHFKQDYFSIFIMTSKGMEPSSYVNIQKKGWNLYPNYHLCYDLVHGTQLTEREVDALLKHPISSKLCSAALQETLTQDQAMILQSIDKHGDLFELVQSNGISLDLVFALHGQEGQPWLGALLDEPKHHTLIEEHRHGPFDQRLWDLVVKKQLKAWQFACMVRLEFNDPKALEILLLSDDIWNELRKVAVLYEVNETLQYLEEIYAPKKEKSLSSSTISLEDVIQTVAPIADFTVNTSAAKSRKKVRKKRGRHAF
jgi:hypothetical protein